MDLRTKRGVLCSWSTARHWKPVTANATTTREVGEYCTATGYFTSELPFTGTRQISLVKFKFTLNYILFRKISKCSEKYRVFRRSKGCILLSNRTPIHSLRRHANNNSTTSGYGDIFWNLVHLVSLWCGLFHRNFLLDVLWRWIHILAAGDVYMWGRRYLVIVCQCIVPRALSS